MPDLTSLFARLWPRSTRRSKHQRRISPTPKPRVPRKHALTISSADGALAMTIHNQAASPLFRLLPLELRLVLYSLVLGQHIIHLGLETQDESRLSPYLRHYYCKKPWLDPATQQPWHGCWWPKGGRPRDPEERLLSLLLTCRMVYSEAVNMLYADNVFNVNELHTFLSLPTVMLPQRLAAISHLALVLQFRSFPPRPEDAAHYTQLWQMLNGMSGLETVHIHIEAKDVCESLWVQDEDFRETWRTTLIPLGARLTEFKVYLPIREQVFDSIESGGPNEVWRLSA